MEEKEAMDALNRHIEWLNQALDGYMQVNQRLTYVIESIVNKHDLWDANGTYVTHDGEVLRKFPKVGI